MQLYNIPIGPVWTATKIGKFKNYLPSNKCNASTITTQACVMTLVNISTDGEMSLQTVTENPYGYNIGFANINFCFLSI